MSAATVAAAAPATPAPARPRESRAALYASLGLLAVILVAWQILPTALGVPSTSSRRSPTA
jgi:hypothetical protein